MMDFLDLSGSWDDILDVNEVAKTTGLHADSVPDSLIMSLTTRGCVDIEFMSIVSGVDKDTVINTLRGSIYLNPETVKNSIYTGWETSEEYLSGNLILKWKAAKEADKKYPGLFEENIKALEKILPPQVASKDIYITLGSPWIPPDVIDQFILYLFGDSIPGYIRGMRRKKIEDAYRVIHDDMTGVWEIPYKRRYHLNVAVMRTYGTSRIDAMHILEDTLNMRPVKIMDEVKCTTNKSGVKHVLNRKETLVASEKQQALIRAFQDWVWKDDARKERLTRLFDIKYGCIRRRIYDGSFLTFPTMSPDVSLYPYQKDAVARMIFSPNTLLAHDVGAGKTYEMIAAGQELRRMGLSKKNLYVVPNNLTGQWESIFRKLYPAARLLIVDPSTFKPAHRIDMLKKIRDLDFDGIIMAYSCFDMIPLSRAYKMKDLDTKIRELELHIESEGNNSQSVRARKKKLENQLIKLRDTDPDDDENVYFDQLKITRLFVDEAHNYKNVSVDIGSDRVLGVSGTGSKKCNEMFEKVKNVQKNNDGKGVIMATGTPITNSITDAYVMQMYLQSGTLDMLNLNSFYNWIGMFAERVTEFEIDVDTSTYRLASRFSKFHNLPELTSLLSAIADFHYVDPDSGIPSHDGYIDTLLAKTPEFSEYLKTISERAEKIRTGSVKRQEDNMLKITTDGRKAALDMRLIDADIPLSNQFKVVKCAANIAEMYRKSFDFMGTQIVFCDSSTPKDGFNLYDELKSKLIDYGIPSDEIAFVHDATSEAKRSSMFKAVSEGRIRVIIGSTAKLGLGVNIQDRLIALHHLDVPWRPADMTQREGRILRQGNMNKTVYLYRYITAGSFDAYSWQLLETKQRFISSLLSGSLTTRSESDINEVVLNYAEIKALAVGNPLVKKRVEVANELSRRLTLQKKLIESRMLMQKELFELPSKIEYQKHLIDNCADDMKIADLTRDSHKEATGSEKKRITEERRLLREKIEEAVRNNLFNPEERTLTSYRGFKIVLPANMIADEPFVFVTRKGRYNVDLGDNEAGNLIRIDNRLDTLHDLLDKYEYALTLLQNREQDLRRELEDKEDYSKEIEYYRKEVERLDKELGVDEDE